jgi:glucose-6-phosphate isomerase, archaeal
MYRDVAKTETDRIWLHSHAVRYDITVIPPSDIGGECMKTKGHYHPNNSAGVGYPELYEVIDGIAHFLLQKKTLDTIVLVEAEKGDIVVIPPGYGHVTINPSEDKTLILANLVSTAFVSEYSVYDALHGAAYYELIGNNLVQNPHYLQVPLPRKIKSPAPHLPTVGTVGSLYDTIGNAVIPDMLNHPEKYAGDFSKYF